MIRWKWVNLCKIKISPYNAKINNNKKKKNAGIALLYSMYRVYFVIE